MTVIRSDLILSQSAFSHIIDVRKESGLSQTEVASRMGLTQQKLSYLELNASSASAERVLALLSVLGVELVLRRPGSSSPCDVSSNTLSW